MKISKRITRTIISLLLIIAASMCFFGCSESEEDYPVTVGNTVFEESPERVAAVSPNGADIMDCIGYSVKVTLVSDDTVTKSLADRERCGSAIDPDTKKIIDNKIQVVIADDNLSDGDIKILEDNNIKVIQLHYGNDDNSILTTYRSIGSIMGGKSGREKAEKAYSTLKHQLLAYKNAVNKKYSDKSIMYLSGTSPYETVIHGSWYNTLLNYSGLKVVSNDIDTPSISINDISKENPDYLVYDGQTFDNIKSKTAVKGAKFLKEGHSLQIPKDTLKMQGSTAIENIRAIVSTIDKEAVKKAEKYIASHPVSQNDSKNDNENNNNKNEKTEETAVTEVTSTVTSTTAPPKPRYELQSKYNVKFTKSAIDSMKKDKENKYIKALQERLSDLGYISEDNTTGYFGDVTEGAIKDFQKNNNLKADGKVSENMLNKLFSSTAKKK